jgi:hypothetical protein
VQHRRHRSRRTVDHDGVRRVSAAEPSHRLVHRNSAASSASVQAPAAHVVDEQDHAPGVREAAVRRARAPSPSATYDGSYGFPTYSSAPWTAADAILDLGLRREEHHRDEPVELALPDLLQQRDAVAVGEEDVEHDEAERRRPERSARGRSRVAVHGREPGLHERLAQVQANREAVVDDEDGRGHGSVHRREASSCRAGAIAPRGSTRSGAPMRAASLGIP